MKKLLLKSIGVCSMFVASLLVGAYKLILLYEPEE